MERTLNMKNILIITLIAALVGSTTATPAKADREGRALVGGLIGGLIIGSIINDDDHHRHNRTSIRYESNHRYDRCGCSGHHAYISVKTWINGRWSIHYDNCGNRFRDWHPGHYSYNKRRVWIPHNRSCRYYSSPSHNSYYDDYRGDRYNGRR